MGLAQNLWDASAKSFENFWTKTKEERSEHMSPPPDKHVKTT